MRFDIPEIEPRKWYRLFIFFFHRTVRLPARDVQSRCDDDNVREEQQQR